MTCSLNINYAAALQFLFTEDLYLISDKSEKTTYKPHTGNTKKCLYFDYQGENNAYFLIVVEEKDQAQIAPNKLEMLLKIMQAKGLALTDLAIINYANYPGVSFSELKSFFACNRLTLFGIDPETIQLPPLPLNKMENINDTKVMVTYSLAEMESNLDKKRDFWSVMKKF